MNAGHQVRIATAEALAHTVHSEGFTVDPLKPYPLEWLRFGATGAPDTADHTGMINKVFRAKGWRGPLLHGLEIGRSYRPDLILRDDFDCVGYVVAEALGVPHIAMSGGITILLDPERLEDPLAAHGTALGLGASGHGLYGYGRVDYVPASHSFTKYEWPLVYSYRQPVLERPGEKLPEWIAALPGDRPLVFAAVGTLIPMLGSLRRAGVRLPNSVDARGRIQLVLEALSQVDCVAVVATGGIDAEDLPRADHVHVTDSVPQPLVLEVADLFLTHCGYNGIREALRSGVPMVADPMPMHDAPHNADRVDELGLGITLRDPDADELAKACAAVLADRTYLDRARHARKQVLALPGIDAALEMLEHLIGP
jgi:N-glycosyltransferase